MQKRLKNKSPRRFLKPHAESIGFKLEKARKTGRKAAYVAVLRRPKSS